MRVAVAAPVLLIGTFICGTPASAGDAVLYQPAPEWVVPADVDSELGRTEEVVLLDRQRMLDHGLLSIYEDVVMRLDTPDTVSQFNTLTIQWYPDKGDLAIHNLYIVRDGKKVDVLADGSRFTVMRRETGLEERELNGRLTAVLSVPGLRVGDILRITKTTTSRDQAFPDDVQMTDLLLAEPIQLGAAREIVSWPADQEIQSRVSGEDIGVKSEQVGGMQRLTIELPVAKQAEMPKDAPLRYRFPPLIEVSSFKSWQDVSQRLAPYFATEGAIEPDGSIAREIARIEARSSEPLERAALALQVVQDDIAYLANGLEGGNYIPKSPAETWDNRYGDCKAKSLLLAAMLREMGIDADMVLVNSQAGDVVATLLPHPGAFDHMIVRAKIGGQTYWLDGTGAGTRLSNIGEVPNFEYALAVTPEGADLATIEPRWQPLPDRVLHITYDYTAGLDMPALFTVDADLTGITAARQRMAGNEKDPKKQREYAAKFLQEIFEDSQLVDGSVSYDPESGTAGVHGVLYYAQSWSSEDGRQFFEPVLASTDFEFAPARGRRAWRDIPTQLGGSSRYREEATFLLPNGGKGFTFSGLKHFDGVVAGRKVVRNVTVKPDRIEFVDDISTIPIEIPADQFSAERAKASTLKSGDPRIEAPADTPYYWQVDVKTFGARTTKLEQALATIIEHNPDEPWPYSMRAFLRKRGPDKQAALADMNRAIELGPTAGRFSERSSLLADMGDLDGSLADAREAYDLTPETNEAINLAYALAAKDEFDDALDLLENLGVSGDEKVSAIMARAEILGRAKYFDEGWALLEDALNEDPADSDLLNAVCWYHGTWKYKLEEAEDNCTKAVKSSDFAPDVLDSRALVYYRLGHTDMALRDLNDALQGQPLMTSSRYLRGIIELAQGASDGRKDLEDAKRRAPSIERVYQRYGIAAPE